MEVRKRDIINSYSQGVSGGNIIQVGGAQ